LNVASAESKLHSIKKEKLEPLEGEERTAEGLQAFTDAGTLAHPRGLLECKHLVIASLSLSTHARTHALDVQHTPVAELLGEYGEHIDEEEEKVVPVVRRFMSEKAQKEVGLEIKSHHQSLPSGKYGLLMFRDVTAELPQELVLFNATFPWVLRKVRCIPCLPHRQSARTHTQAADLVCFVCAGGHPGDGGDGLLLQGVQDDLLRSLDGLNDLHHCIVPPPPPR
jgi:hypothetical protein